MGTRPDEGTKPSDAAMKVNQWAEYSMTPHPFEEIKEKAIRDATTNRDTELCYSYISQYNNTMTDDEIMELSVISSPLYLMMSELSRENILVASEILCRPEQTQQKAVIRLVLSRDVLSDTKFKRNLHHLLFQDITKGKIEDRLDWRSIGRYQLKISDAFRQKYDTLINPSEWRIETTPRTKNGTPIKQVRPKRRRRTKYTKTTTE